MTGDHLAEFRRAIAGAGLAPPAEIFSDGRLHRFAANGKPTDDAGWYVLHLDGVPAGSFGDWRSGLAETWRANLGRRLSPDEQAAHRARVAAMRQQREAEAAQRKADARETAAAIWDAANAAPSDHPYLLAKAIQPHGLREHDGRLLVPLRDGAELHSLQFIAADGAKLFLTGGRVSGCYFGIGKPDDVLLICEGVATGASIHEATGGAVAVAFNAGNLLAVATGLQAKFPGVRLIVCADDDASTAGNPGLTKAREAAEAVGGTLAVPDFGANRPDGASDFNDLRRHAGLAAVRAAIEGAAPATAPAGIEPAYLLPAITLKAGDLAALVDQSAAVLRAGGAQIYRRGSDLFRTSRLETDDAGPVRREAGAIVLRFVDPEWLHVELARAATWWRFDAREKKAVPSNPPAELARLILARADDHAWPTLRAIARHPIVTLDGRLITAAGYDAGTGLLLDIGGAWPIPENPTRADAVAACALLSDLLRYFPWAGPADFAVALSLLVTAVMRPVLPTAPLHGVDAPEAGSGKSLLVDAAAILATGQRAAVLEYGRNAEEAGKRIDSALLAGDAVLALDNVEAPLEGAALCQTLTATTRAIRVLGQSKNVTVPCSALLTATGNNLTLRGDIVRRCLVCRLDPETDRPELRRFDQDLLAEVHARRCELVAAALTIPLAYIAAGRPDVGLVPLGSFEEWSGTVRAALTWAGTADACDTIQRARDVDPSRQTLGAVLAEWRGRFGADGSTAAAAVDLAEREAALRDVLADVCMRHGKLDARALGNWLRVRRDTRAGTLVLRSRSTRHRFAVWTVEDTGRGESGESGESESNHFTRNVRQLSIDDVTNRGKAAESDHLRLTGLTPEPESRLDATLTAAAFAAGIPVERLRENLSAGDLADPALCTLDWLTDYARGLPPVSP